MKSRGLGLGRAFAACALSLVVACGSTAGDPVALRYSVEFPSRAAAVATDRVQIYAFEGRLDCSSLISSYGPPSSWATPPVSETSAVSPCQLGNATLALPFGEYTLLAVGTAGTSELLIGCANQTFNGKVEVLPVRLTIFDFARPIPPTDCTLADKCGGRSCGR